MPLISAVMGSMHQGSGLFASAGTQCTAIALFAIATLFATNLPATDYTSFDVDRIIYDGNDLYESILCDRGYNLSTYLAHDELPDNVIVDGHALQTNIYHDIFFGYVSVYPTRDGAGALSLIESLTSAFQLSEYILATFGDLTIALAYQNGQYCIFDSHSCNYIGQTDPFGSSVLLQFTDLDSVLEYLSNRFRNTVFNISPVIFNYQYEGLSLHDQSSTDVGDDYVNHATVGEKVLNSSVNKVYDFKHVGIPDKLNKDKWNYASHDKDNVLNESHVNKGIVINVTASSFVQDYVDHEKDLDKYIEFVDINSHIDVENIVSVKSKMSDHSYCFSDSSRRKKRKYAAKTPNTINVEIHSGSCVQTLPAMLEYNFDNNTLTSDIVEIVTLKPDMIRTDEFTSACMDQRFFSDITKKPSFVCSSCDKFLFEYQVYKLNKEFVVSNEHSLMSNSVVCLFCYNNVKKGQMPPCNTLGNDMNPGILPLCLQGLTLMERRLICKIQVFMTVIVLPGGQFAERGLAIDFPINFEQQIFSLPHSFEDSNVITVAYEYNKEIKPTHVVRKNKIIQALLWLKANNILYSNVSLQQDFFNDYVEVHEDVVDRVEDEYDEYGITAVDYTVPDVDVEKLLTGHIPHLALKKCDSVPINAYDIDNGEESAFPHLFPYGTGGFKYKRKIPISNSKYFQHRLYYKDGRYRKDFSYLLHAVNFYERCRLYNSINIHMRMRKNKKSLTAGEIVDFRNNPDLVQNSYMFMKNVKGTAAYWKNNLLNLLAIFKSIGPPSLFVTLSANDMHWPDLIMTLSGCDYESACRVTNSLNLVKKDPLLTAIHFQRRFKSLLKHVIYGPLKPFGKVVDHFGRIEFQNRGSPHIHLFFWIENFSDIFNDQTLLINYIDKVISTDSCTSRFAKKFQTHRHSDYCLKKSRRCRFGFPFSDCTSTHLLSNVDLGSENLKNRFYETKRPARDSYVNAFNPVILDNWQANMDIQIVGNSESAAYYVCAYLCKSEPDDLKCALSKLLNAMDNNICQRSRMMKIGSCVLKTRKLSAQEAAYRLVSDLHLIFNSRSVISLNTKPPEQRYHVLKSKKERDELEESSTDIFYTNVVDYYSSRPSSLSKLCLYEFAAWYTKCVTKSTVRSRSERITLKHPFGDISMKKRKRCVAIRLPKFSIASDAYFYNLLMSFVPFENESNLLKRCDGTVYNSARDAFIEKKDQIAVEHLQSLTFIDEIENAMHFIQCSRIELASCFNPATYETDNTEENEQADISVPAYPESEMPEYDETQCFQSELIQSATVDEDSHYLHHLETAYISKNDLILKLKQLSKSQKCVMETVMNHFKSNTKSPLRLFITGGAGVGKSYVTKLMIEWLKSSTAIQMGKSPVMVCAPTGTASRNIMGNTLHSMLHLPVQHGRQPKFFELSGKSLKKLRTMYSTIHTIIIDEISMVSSITFEHIHKRLSSIKDTSEPFGGLNVLLVGDFLQLRPVRGRYCFENKYLWSLFNTMFLNENVRQKGDNVYAQLLNRARVGLLTKEDIDTLQSRLLHPIADNITSILHLFPTLKDVCRHNRKMQSLIHEDITTIPAVHYFSRDDNERKYCKEVTEDLIPSDDRVAGGLKNILEISKNTRIMLIRNIYTTHGLVNGALGYVQDIITDLEKQIITTVYVKFDDDSIGGILKTPSQSNAIAIQPICQEFFYSGRIIIREQFPLVPAWAVTIHKVQGASLEKAVISIGNDIFENGMAYVALSRIKNLSGLYISALNSQKICPPLKPLTEYSRLRNLN